MTTSGLSSGAVAFLTILAIILFGGVVAGTIVYRRNKREREKWGMEEPKVQPETSKKQGPESK